MSPWRTSVPRAFIRSGRLIVTMAIWSFCSKRTWSGIFFLDRGSCYIAEVTLGRRNRNKTRESHNPDSAVNESVPYESLLVPVVPKVFSGSNPLHHPPPRRDAGEERVGGSVFRRAVSSAAISYRSLLAPHANSSDRDIC